MFPDCDYRYGSVRNSPHHHRYYNKRSRSTQLSQSPQGKKALMTGLGAGLGVGLPLLSVIGLQSFFLFREKKRYRAIVNSMTNGENHDPTPIVFIPPRYQKGVAGPSHPSTELTDPTEIDTRAHSAQQIEADSRVKNPRPELHG